MDPHRLLPTARPTAEYFPVANPSAAHSLTLSPTMIIKIHTALPSLLLHGPQINNCHTMELDVTR
jgi:hypothetical protein